MRVPSAVRACAAAATLLAVALPAGAELSLLAAIEREEAFLQRPLQVSMHADSLDPSLGASRASASDPEHPLLRGLVLTDAQRDAVFAILHAQAPALRHAEKALRRSQDALLALSRSPDWTEPKARELVDASSRTLVLIAYLRADTEHRIWDVLNDEQRRQADVIQQTKRSVR